MGRKSAAHSAIGGITSNIVCDRVQRRAVENGNRRNALRFSTLLRCRSSMRVISAFIKLTKVALVLYAQQTFSAIASSSGVLHVSQEQRKAATEQPDLAVLSFAGPSAARDFRGGRDGIR